MRKVVLSELIKSLESGSRPAGGVDEDETGVISIGGEHITREGSFDWKNKRYISHSYYANLNHGKVKKNDILIVKDGATTGKTSYVSSDFPFEQAAINEHVFRIEVDKDAVNPSYLFWFLFSPSGQNEILKDFRGATVGGISRGFINLVNVPIHPREYQDSVAIVLNKLQSIINKKRLILGLVDEFLKASFIEMFGDPGQNLHNFEVKKIRDLVESVDYGTSLKSSSEGKYGYLRMNNISYEGYLDLNDMKYISLDKLEAEKYLVRNGDLLFNRTNSIDLVGKTSVFRGDEEMVIAGYLLRVRSNAKKINNDYLSGYLNSNYGKALLKNMGKGIIGMANINANEFKDIRILVPPINLQNKYSKIVSKCLRIRNNILTNVFPAVNSLFDSVLQKAFQGKLKVDNVGIFEYSLNDITAEKLNTDNKQLDILLDRVSKRDFKTREAYEESCELLFELLGESESPIDQTFNVKTKKIEVKLN